MIPSCSSTSCAVANPVVMLVKPDPMQRSASSCVLWLCPQVMVVRLSLMIAYARQHGCDVHVGA